MILASNSSTGFQFGFPRSRTCTEDPYMSEKVSLEKLEDLGNHNRNIRKSQVW